MKGARAEPSVTTRINPSKSGRITTGSSQRRQVARSFRSRRLEFLPRFPCALPVFFCGPGFCFEKMKVTRATRKLGKVPGRQKRFVDLTFAHLFVVELIANSVIIRHCMKRLPELLDRSTRGRVWQGLFFSKMPDDRERAAKIIPAGVILRHRAPGVT